MIPPLNGLRAFEAVARHLNFTKAADELHVTQSAVSHQVRNLEAFLGTALFDRAGGRLTLTAAGQVLLPGVREAIASIGRAVSSLKAMDEGRPLGLVTRSHFALKWLAPRLEHGAGSRLVRRGDVVRSHPLVARQVPAQAR